MGRSAMGGVKGWRLRHAAAVVVAAFLAFSAVAEDMAEVTEVIEADADGAGHDFSVIPGFAPMMLGGATEVENKSKDGCANLCMEESKCHSFSYRLKTKTCIWFMSSLIFDPDWVLASKTKYAKDKMFRRMAGLTYRTAGQT